MESVPNTLPPHLADTSILASRIVFQQNTGSGSFSSAFDTTFTSAGITRHVDLSIQTWVDAGHTGTPSTFAVFDGSGVATEISIFNDTNAQTGCTANQLLAGVNGCTSTPTITGTNITGVPDGGLSISYIKADGTRPLTSSWNTGQNIFIPNTKSLVIGHTSQISIDGTTPEFQLLGTGNADSTIAILRTSDSTPPGDIVIAKARGSLATPSVIITGDDIGAIRAIGHDGTNLNTRVAEIVFDSEGTIATNQIPGVIKLRTANSSGIMTNALIIDSSQNTTLTGTLDSGAITSTGDMSIDGAFFTRGANFSWVRAGVGQAGGEIIAEIDATSFTTFSGLGIEVTITGDNWQTAQTAYLKGYFNITSAAGGVFHTSNVFGTIGGITLELYEVSTDVFEIVVTGTGHYNVEVNWASQGVAQGAVPDFSNFGNAKSGGSVVGNTRTFGVSNDFQVSGNTTLVGTLGSGAITSTGTIDAVGGLTVSEAGTGGFFKLDRTDGSASTFTITNASDKIIFDYVGGSAGYLFNIEGSPVLTILENGSTTVAGTFDVDSSANVVATLDGSHATGLIFDLDSTTNGDVTVRYQSTNNWSIGSDSSDNGDFSFGLGNNNISAIVTANKVLTIRRDKSVNMISDVNVGGGISTAGTLDFMALDFVTGDFDGTSPDAFSYEPPTGFDISGWTLTGIETSIITVHHSHTDESISHWLRGTYIPITDSFSIVYDDTGAYGVNDDFRVVFFLRKT